MATASNTSISRPRRRSPVRSKRTPDMYASLNEADCIERLLEVDGFRTWGLVIYRCTYKSVSDWEEFMRRFLWHVRDSLEFYNGLDLLDSFAPTVLEDKAFDGATTSVIREHFKQWAVTASQQEQGVPIERARWAESERYRLCLMVNEEALQSVLNNPPPDGPATLVNEHGFVILINGRWVPEELDEDELEALGSPLEDDFDPVEGCTLEDVGWMRVRYDRAEMEGTLCMQDWRTQYMRPPEIGFRF